MTALRRREGALLIPGGVFGIMLIERWGRQADGSYFFTLFDDAAISKTYARTLAETGELVWFPGADRVEGISNLLWALVMAAVHAIGFSGSSAALAISVIGLLLLVAHSAQVGRLTRRLLEGHSDRDVQAAVALATLVSGMAYPLIFWTLRGFETGLIALLYVLVVHRALDVEERVDASRSRSVSLFALLAVVLAFIRLDALVVPLAVTGWMLYRGFLSRSEVVRLFGIVASGLALLSLWRFAYFGSFVPNTYFLKVSDAPTTLRIERGLWVSVKLLPIVGAVLLALWVDGRNLFRQVTRPERWQLLPLVFGGLVAYSIYVGGDAWEWTGFANRFIAPGLGIAVAVASAGIVSVLRRLSARFSSPPWHLVVAGGISGVAALLAVRGGDLLGLIVRLTPLDEVVADRLGYGRNAAPEDWAAWFTNVFAFPLWGIVIVGLLVISVALHSRGRRWPAVGLTGFLLLGSVWSAFDPASSWARALQGVHVSDDAFMSEFGSAISESTTADATVAIVWAGNIAYYSERPVIDLLGKSDPIIARLNPDLSSWRDLYPGHNKWDYAYSVGTLRPDLVAQTWRATKEDHANFREWGYSEWCLGATRVLVADESPRVDRNRLLPIIDGSCASRTR
jgi:hypothetical protein